MAGTRLEHLVGALDRLRMTFRWKAEGLDAAGLQTRIGASSLTLGRLLKHLASNEDYMFTKKLRGDPIGAPWDATGWDGSNDWEFSSAADDTPDQLYACTTVRSNAHARGSTPPWPTAASTRSSTPRRPTGATPACAGWCAT